MRILGLDFETTGLSPEKDRIIEVGAVLWDTERRNPVRIISEMIMYDPEGVESIPPFIEKLTGITAENLNEFGRGFCQVLNYELQSLLSQADFLVAHNAPFDRGFLEMELIRINESWRDQVKHFKWIDSRTDLPREAYTKGRSTSLGYLAADHGFINPFPHRAVTDVLTMLKLVDHYPIDEIVKRSQAKTITVVALVSMANKDKAKERGFHWDPKHKLWKQNVKECDLPELAESWDFEVQELVP